MAKLGRDTSPGSRGETTEDDTHVFIRILHKGILPLVVVLAIWQTIVFLIPHLPSLADVASAFIRLAVEGDTDGYTLLQHTQISMVRVTWGIFSAALTAIPLGIVIGRYRFIEGFAGPVVEAMRPIPPIAWIPISILLFRANLLAGQVFIIWIGAFFPILLNTVAGVKRTDPVHLDVARTFGAKEHQVLSKIVVPSAAPEIFAGLRIGFGIGFMCLVAAEMIGGGLGLGYLVIVTEQLGRTGETISAMLVIGMIGFLINYLFQSTEKYVLKWRREVSV